MYSFYAALSSAGYLLLFTLIATSILLEMATVEDKLDALLTSMNALKQAQNDSQREVAQQMEQLESDVVRNQEGMAQRLLKRLKRERQPVFKRKGNERQFQLLEEVKDRVESANELLDRLKPESHDGAATIEEAKEELEEDVL